MEYEIELKLLTNEQAGEWIDTQLLTLLQAKVVEQSLTLENHYFDTPERTLRHLDIGLRIRGTNQSFEQTLKTAGKSIGGLHQRPEFNVQLDTAKQQNIKLPDLSLFPSSAWPEHVDVDDLQAKIIPLFTTHFERKVYLLKFSQHNIVEMVWDLGKVSSGNQSTPICEIELELKAGQASTLFDLAKTIVNLMPTAIGTDSKAARGYHLLDGLPTNKPKPFKLKQLEGLQTATEFSTLLTALLKDFQQVSVDIRRKYSQELATIIKSILFGLVECVHKFHHHCPCPFLESAFMELKKLDNDLDLLLEQSSENAVSALLTCSQTTQLQLDLVQFIVEQT